MIDLQSPHPISSPKQILSQIAYSCQDLNITKFDVYGDFESDVQSSFLRNFESQVAETFGKEDAVFMPSGTMAQQIALLVHSQKVKGNSVKKFACHHTSHLLLWENDAYKMLSGFQVVEISTRSKANGFGLNVPPLSLSDVENMFNTERSKDKSDGQTSMFLNISSLMIELPHRELGGKLTPFHEVEAIGKLCKEKGVCYHCDGARIFEACAGYGKTLDEVASPFDSIYISFYKGLGGLSGSMLIGDKVFCEEARIWLRRFGGNLYTLLPYSVSSYVGFQYHALGIGAKMTFQDKFEKLRRITQRILNETDFSKVAAFDPPIPETNMIHIYFKASIMDCETARDQVMQKYGYQVFRRIRSINDPLPQQAGYISYLEWTIGEANGVLDDNVFVEAWAYFIDALLHT